MTKTPRPKRAHLERDLIVAQQQRDRALERAEAAEAELARRDNADRVKSRPLPEGGGTHLRSVGGGPAPLSA